MQARDPIAPAVGVTLQAHQNADGVDQASLIYVRMRRVSASYLRLRGHTIPVASQRVATFSCPHISEILAVAEHGTLSSKGHGANDG